jgi:hypothetical protein
MHLGDGSNWFRLCPPSSGPARFAGAGLAFFPKSFAGLRARCYNGGYRSRGSK